MNKKLLLLLSAAVCCLPLRASAQNLLWDFATPFSIVASPAVARDGTIYVCSYDRFIYSLTPAGVTNWATELQEPTYIFSNSTYTAVYGTPAIGSDGTLYVPSENSQLLALNPTNGAIKWAYTNAAEGLYSSPALAADGTIYFGGYDSNLFALNPNGSVKWTAPFDSTIFASPVVGRDGTIYCGADSGKFYAINPTNGAPKWVFTTGNKFIAASPAIDTNGNLYIGVASTNNPKLYCISTNGATNWVFTAGSGIESSAALGVDGTVYFGCNDGKLYSLKPNGTSNWVFNTGSPVKSSPAITADGTICFGSDNGKLYAVNTNGNQLWTFTTGDKVSASPAIGADGTIYFASDDGALYVVRGCSPPALSSWPMHRRDLQRAARAAAPLTNHAPVLPAITDRVIYGLTPLVFTNTATDSESPPQQLAYSLGIAAPTGATINPTNGVFAWTPPQAYLPSTNVISVVATDNGTPALSAVRCFTVVIAESVSGTVELQSFAGTNRLVRFVASQVGGSTNYLQTNDLLLTFSGGVAAYRLQVPTNATHISAKTAWNLRRRQAVTFTGGAATVNFTGDNNKLKGGDLVTAIGSTAIEDSNNAVTSSDYLLLLGNYLQTVGGNALTGRADITGDGAITSSDYLILLGNYLTTGDAQ